MKIALILMGSLCIFYALAVWVSVGFSKRVTGLSVGCAVIFGVLTLLWVNSPGWVKIFETVLLAAVFVPVFIEGLRISLFAIKSKGEKEVDRLIILGATTFGMKPCMHLRRRLDAAVRLLDKNPRIITIASGGNCWDSGLTEAEIMKEYILSNVSQNVTVLTEEDSCSTHENLLLSKKLIKSENECVGIVTNGYHLFRALQMAKDVGFKNATPVYAPSVKIYLPYDMIREIVILFVLFFNQRGRREK